MIDQAKKDVDQDDAQGSGETEKNKPDHEQHVSIVALLEVEEALWDYYESLGCIQPPYEVQDALQCIAKGLRGNARLEPTALASHRFSAIRFFVERDMSVAVLLCDRLPDSKKEKAFDLMAQKGYVRYGRFYRKGGKSAKGHPR